MRIELIRPVKNGGKWHAPGASLDVSDELAKELVSARVAFTVPDPVGPIGPNSPAPETELGANEGEGTPGELGDDETAEGAAQATGKTNKKGKGKTK